jgi:8-amino-7-oxononanoate synthase
MKEMHEIAAWLAEATPHAIDYVESLPSPTFRAMVRRQVSFSSNNYLALASSPRLIAAARQGLDRYGVGNCESRLLGGNLKIYDALERKLATLKHKESAVLFATGYLTNLGVLSSLPRIGAYARIYGYSMRGTYTYAYFSDEFSHVSIREGTRKSGAERHTYRHCDLNHLETLLRGSSADSRIIVTDGVFSQDGDIADLPGLLALAERYDAIVYVDDAHGTGVLGKHGEGTSEHFGVKSPRLIQMGTLSKAYGAIGGFIATDTTIADVLRLSCAAYGFTSTLPPDQAIAVSEALDAVRDEPERRRRLWHNQRYFVSRMGQLPFTLVSTATPIVPIMIGDEALTDQFAALLQAEDIHVDAVKFPAVPIRKSRLRIQLNAGHTRAQIDRLVGILEESQDLVAGKKSRPQVRPGFDKALVRIVPRPWAAAAFAILSNGKEAALSAFDSLRDKVSSAFASMSRTFNPHRHGLQSALNLVTIATAILLAVDLSFDIPHLIFAYLLPILFVAIKFGRFPALVATTTCGLSAAFFIYEPQLSIYIDDTQDIVELVIFCAIASLISYFFDKRSSVFAMRRL